MAATVEIHEMTGASAGTAKQTGSGNGSMRFKAADDTTSDQLDPLRIPPSGQGPTLSYTKQARFYVSVAPTNYLENLRTYAGILNTFEGSAWQASTAYSLGDIVVATTYNGQYIYECTTAGTSGGSEPTWTTTVDQTVNDNTVVWTCRAARVKVQYDVQSSWAANVNTNISGTDIFTKDENSPIDMDDGVAQHSGTGYHGAFLRQQMVIEEGANSGILGEHEFTYAYDEV